MAFEIKSESFQSNSKIPVEYTGEGNDISPPLTWEDLPEGTRELALICDDPDAPMDEPFVHWVAYGIPADNKEIPEAISKEPEVESPIPLKQGKNSFGYTGYGGPMPPKGHGTHHYHFRLYALDEPISTDQPLDKEALLSKMKGHILGETELIGTYERQ